MSGWVCVACVAGGTGCASGCGGSGGGGASAPTIAHTRVVSCSDSQPSGSGAGVNVSADAALALALVLALALAAGAPCRAPATKLTALAGSSSSFAAPLCGGVRPTSSVSLSCTSEGNACSAVAAAAAASNVPPGRSAWMLPTCTKEHCAVHAQCMRHGACAVHVHRLQVGVPSEQAATLGL